jgi:ureidoacrylate peracid hydrolase
MPETASPSPGAGVHLDSAERRERRLAEAHGHPAALLLIDLQNDYCHPDGVFARAGFAVADLAALVAAVNDLLAGARAGGRPVVWTATVWNDREDVGRLAQRSPFLAEAGLRRGSWGAEMLAELDFRPEQDVVVEKRRFSAFHETSLQSTLHADGTDTLVVGGVRTDFCVESTVRDAFFRDHDVFVVGEAVAGYVPQLHEHSLQLMNTVFAQVVDVADARTLLQAAAGAGRRVD